MENKIYLASIDGGTYASESKISNAFGMHGKTIVSDSEITKVDGFIDLNLFKKSSENVGTDFKDLKDGLKKSEERRLAANLRIESLTKSYEECKRELNLIIDRVANGVVRVPERVPTYTPGPVAHVPCKAAVKTPVKYARKFKSKMHELSNGQIAVVIEMYNKNKTKQKIADMVGKSMYIVNMVIREMLNNGDLSPRKPLRQKFRRCFDNVEDLLVIQLHRSGMRTVDIGKKVGRSKQSIYNRINILKRKGIINTTNNGIWSNM